MKHESKKHEATAKLSNAPFGEIAEARNARTPTDAPKPDAPKPDAPKPDAPSVEVSGVAPLPEDATLEQVVAKVNELLARQGQKRDRGPTSKREMTEEDARRVVLGDLKDVPHGKAAEVLGLSYGQVYSARGGFTFKKVYQEWHKANGDRAVAGPKS